MKIVVVLFLIAILVSLGTALFSLMRNKEASNKTVKALTLRVALSVSLFILLMIAYKMGWIQPHGVS
ncbi:twin transmembrane helix small protein [Chitinimonas sp. BJYL2]|uniref:twin transmembrane helix small protein n=1 Tax=Chitinimonas sp. BJYL2 TaxID=2976696 RepID=UPI0022B45320|nr:twin transmembrane helix small protein [Chitinimonas sp. BJYL2]